MNIIIDDSRKIWDVQQEFSSRYPFLRLEFFKLPDMLSQSYPFGFSDNRFRVYKGTIAGCRSMHNGGYVVCSPLTTVKELERKFMDDFGLCVKVFRQSGLVWLKTSLTDSWTLEEQNRQGKQLTLKDHAS